MDHWDQKAIYIDRGFTPEKAAAFKDALCANLEDRPKGDVLDKSLDTALSHAKYYSSSFMLAEYYQPRCLEVRDLRSDINCLKRAKGIVEKATRGIMDDHIYRVAYEEVWRPMREYTRENPMAQKEIFEELNRALDVFYETADFLQRFIDSKKEQIEGHKNGYPLYPTESNTTSFAEVLIRIWCDIRKIRVAHVPVGNAEGGASPLIRYLEISFGLLDRVRRDKARPGEHQYIYIDPPKLPTLRKLALQVRNQARDRLRQESGTG